MPLQGELQSQFSGVQAQAIGGSNALAVTAAGGTQATATALAAANSVITTATAAANGVILPSGKQPFDQFNVANTSSVNVAVYPPVGGNLNGAATNAPCLMAANTIITFFCVSNLNWLADSI